MEERSRFILSLRSEEYRIFYTAMGRRRRGKRVSKSKQVTRHQQSLDDSRVVFVGTAHDSWRNNCDAERGCREYFASETQMKDVIHKHFANVN